LLPQLILEWQATRSGREKVQLHFADEIPNQPSSRMSTAPTSSNCALLFAGQGTDVSLTLNRLLKCDKAEAARACFARASKVIYSHEVE